MHFTVRVRENSHYMDESEGYTLGPFATYEAAEAKCREIVDDFLRANTKTGKSADALFSLYTTFGEDPSVAGKAPPGAAFSAWDYARRRCREICGA